MGPENFGWGMIVVLDAALHVHMPTAPIICHLLYRYLTRFGPLSDFLQKHDLSDEAKGMCNALHQQVGRTDSVSETFRQLVLQGVGPVAQSSWSSDVMIRNRSLTHPKCRPLFTNLYSLPK